MAFTPATAATLPTNGCPAHMNSTVAPALPLMTPCRRQEDQIVQLRVRVQFPYVPLVGLYPLATSVEREFSMATEYQP